MKRLYVNIIFLLAVTLFMCGCNNNRAEMKRSDSLNDQKRVEIKQKQSDLLAGKVSAVCYSGFRSGQHPDRGDGAVNPTESEILEDLKLISEEAGFSLIRLYDSGINSEAVLRIITDNDLDIKVMLGIWLNAEISNHKNCAWLNEPIPAEVLKSNREKNAGEIERAITLANKYSSIVVAVNVGNEALVDWTDHLVGTDTVISYVRHVKKAIKQPVTVAENYEWWAARGKDLAAAVDFLSVHIYPVWEEKDIDEGMSYSIENIEKVKRACPGNTIVISEAGWATVSSEFGARASEEKQQRYFSELTEWAVKMNITTFWFEAFDEDWKGNPDDAMGAEKHWGLFTVGREPKLVAKELLRKVK